jgi:hypothetical protein
MQEQNNCNTTLIEIPLKKDQDDLWLNKRLRNAAVQITCKKYVDKTASPKEYAQDNGMHCPFCRSYTMTSGNIEIDDTQIFQKISCLECGESWCDIYKLAGYYSPKTVCL